MEIKLDILTFFLPYILFQHVDQSINIFSSKVEKAGDVNGILTNNINPFMVAVKIL